MKKLLFQPVSPFVLNQAFGENKICISTNGTRKIINCDGHNPPEGYKSLYGAKGHLGIDLRAKHGQEVYAARDGVVYKIDTDPKSGLDVRIESEDNGVRFRHIYEHLMGYQPKVGDRVKTGQLIGWADNTGYSSGDHLHFQFEVWDGKKWEPTNPIPYMEPVFAKDFLAKYNTVLYLKEQLAKVADALAVYLRTIK